VNSYIELKIPSQQIYLGVPDAVLMELASDLSCEKKVIDELSTSVIEACTNAMEHGNSMQEDLLVEIHFKLTETQIQVTILDYGGGFDYQSWQPPEDLMRERGRGILIMREFTDNLEFGVTEDGRFRAQLTKQLNSDS
jgi:serine/threonine-protein kinase RsbW